MTISLVASGIMVVMAAVVLWSERRQRAAIERLDDRLSHLIAGVSLLTDTTEGGLRDTAAEIGRLAGASSTPKPRTRVATQRRMASAARRGRSVQDIAAAEQVSEGEVRLRLELNRAEKDAHAALR